MPQNHIITITGSGPGNRLTLSDNGRTNVDPGDTVTWVIGQGSGVSAITSIANKATSINVFSQVPAPVGGSTNWKGTVNPNAQPSSQELYNIGWKDASGRDYTYDPTIHVKP